MHRPLPKPAVRLLYRAWLNLPFARPLLDRLMQRAFDYLAPTWHEHTNWGGRLDPLFTALRELDPTPARVVDLGCGSGDATIELAKRFGSAWVVGVDISERMLALARIAARDAGAAVQFVHEPIEGTSLADGSVDLIVLVNAPPPFHEIARLLSPSGRAVVVHTQGSETWFYSSPTRLRRGFARAGMTEVCSGTAGKGEYFAAAPAALPARSSLDAGARERAARAHVAEARH